MLTAIIIIGALIAILICGALSFKDRCSLFEFAIKHQRISITEDMDSDWLQFKARAGLSNDPVAIKTLWTELVKGQVSTTFLWTLRLSCSRLSSTPQDVFDEWMFRYKKRHSDNLEDFLTLNNDYSKYIKESPFSWSNRYWGYPKI